MKKDTRNIHRTENPPQAAIEQRILQDVAAALATHIDVQDVFNLIMEKGAQLPIPTELGVLLLWDVGETIFRPQGVYGPIYPHIQRLSELRLQAGESITGKVFAEGKGQLIADRSLAAKLMDNLRPPNRDLLIEVVGEQYHPTSGLAVPVKAGDRIFGVLILVSFNDKSPGFVQGHLPFVQTLADLIALAIERSRLVNELTAIRETRRAEWLQDESLSTLSHELRTPLAAIKGYATALLLEEVDWPDEKRHEFLGLIDEECDNLERMINDILDASMIDVGQMVIEFQPVRLDRLCNMVAEEMQRRTDVHNLVVDFPAEFPIVDADPFRIKQVIRNIIDNSIKYSPDGGLIVIRGEIRPEDVAISISDQGVGISPEDLIPLFEKYFRVKSPTGYHVPGTGLGLPVARAIVEEHGGRIWASSEVGAGTTLFFSIPRHNHHINGVD